MTLIKKKIIYMTKCVTILNVGAEGGSITLIQKGSYFFYSTDETSMLDLLPDEFEVDELINTSAKFNTFDDAMNSLLNKYPVFYLYPISVHPEFSQNVKKHFLKFKSNNDENGRFEEWDSIFLSIDNSDIKT